MKSKWSDSKLEDDMDQRVYSSRLLGSEDTLVLHGGGNTSLKHKEKDHTGREVEVLRVKASGFDLAEIDRHGFAGLRMGDLLEARKISQMADEELMDYLRKSMIDPSGPSPSVETFLHAFLPFRFVDHSHADAILSITNRKVSEEEIRKILPNVLVVPYFSPGLKLAHAVLERVAEIGDSIGGIVLMKHGLFTFGATAKESYERHIRIVSAAEDYVRENRKGMEFRKIYPEADPAYVESFLPEIRGALSKRSKKILHVDRSESALSISRSEEAEKFSRCGPATPDMLIRTKYRYLYVDDASKAVGLIGTYSKEYAEEYGKYVKDYPMHDPVPSAIIIRGYGLVTAGPDARQAEIVHDMVMHSLEVNFNASILGEYEFVSKDLAYWMEYWPLQEAKLRKAKHAKLRGSVALVSGAASGIGLEAFRKLSEKGALVVACDIDKRIGEVSDQVSSETGIKSIPFAVDLSDEAQISKMFKDIVAEVGGIDIVFNNAGILKSAPFDEITAEDMDLHYKVNSRASFIVSREAFKIMKKQGTGGNFVFNITKNLLHPGPGMASYGSSKAFAAQLCHYIAKEGGKYGIRANIINPDKVFRGSRIWEDGVLEARAKAKGQTVEEYKTQNLLRREVLPSHVANMLLAMIDEDIFGATTDAMVPVDGGVI